MNTTLEEIISLYLAKIENYDYLQYTEEELLEELKPMLLSATSKLLSLDVKIDFDMEEFNIGFSSSSNSSSVYCR